MADSPTDPPSDPSPVIVLVRDLMFSSRISATARAVNAPVVMIRDPQALKDKPGRLLIVDLNQDGALEAAIAWKGATGAHVVGFVSHVDAGTIAKASAAGVDQVMARSKFVNVLADLVRPAS